MVTNNQSSWLESDCAMTHTTAPFCAATRLAAAAAARARRVLSASSPSLCARLSVAPSVTTSDAVVGAAGAGTAAPSSAVARGAGLLPPPPTHRANTTTITTPSKHVAPTNSGSACAAATGSALSRSSVDPIASTTASSCGCTLSIEPIIGRSACRACNFINAPTKNSLVPSP